ncbi:hypothetical protein [Streptomyces chilikensis]|uniref:Uncharacterized protein n=1 Tax=Streptomyces chilikensis TaxID=1194079 RepID=A0ABV3EJB8_9ACTN
MHLTANRTTTQILADTLKAAYRGWRMTVTTTTGEVITLKHVRPSSDWFTGQEFHSGRDVELAIDEVKAYTLHRAKTEPLANPIRPKVMRLARTHLRRRVPGNPWKVVLTNPYLAVDAHRALTTDRAMVQMALFTDKAADPQLTELRQSFLAETAPLVGEVAPEQPSNVVPLMDPDQAATLLCLRVVEPGAKWVARALATPIPCRQCGKRLKVTVAGGAAAPELDATGRLQLGPDSATKDELGSRLCDGCYELAGWENDHSDGAHDDPHPECPFCQGVAAVPA